MTAEPPSIFISYSHKNEAWKDRLVSHLRVLELEGALDVWDDRRIAAGDDWRPSIEQAIDRAKVAILIISKDFLTSRFIRERELTKILAGRTERGLWVIPLIAEPCAWRAVSVLQGIQARPRDGRPLSEGTEHQIDADLTELAVEVLKGRELREPTPTGIPRGVRASRGARSTWLLAWLCGSGLLAALLLVTATHWRLSTFVSLDLLTERVSFVVRGTRQVFDPSLEFSALMIEQCGGATFESVDLVNKGASARAPGPTRLTCRDPDAKITLTSGGDTPIRLGSLRAFGLDPGTTVGIEVAGGRVPVVTLALTGHPLILDVPLEHDLDVIADLVELEPTTATGTPGLVRLTGTLRDAPRHVARLETSDRGAVLVVTLTGENLHAAFQGQERLPVESPRVDREALGGAATTALLDDGSLSYLDYPTIPRLSIPRDNAIVLEHMTQAHVRGLRLESVDKSGRSQSRPAIRLIVEGNLIRGAIGTGDRGRPEQPNQGRWSDPRLTVYDVLTQGRWRLVALVAVWTGVTLWAAYLGWRRLSL